jgi:hypothetical protein
MTDSRHTGFYGQTGTGKSHEVKRRLQAHPRVIVIDVNDEFSEHSTRRKGPLRECMTVAELRKYPTKILEPQLSLALVGLDPLKPRDAARAVETVARLQSTVAKATGQTPERLLLVLDECGTYARHCEATLASLATTGGQHLGVTLWVVAQRPVLVPKTVRSQLKELVLFHMAEPGDLEAVEERTHEPGLSRTVRDLPEEFRPGRKPFVTWSAGRASAAPAPAPQPETVVTPQPNAKEASP